MMASVAEFEARRISECTKEALAKARGVHVGGCTGQGLLRRLKSERRRLWLRPRICVDFSS